MRYIRDLFFALLLSVLFVGCSTSQTSFQPPTPTLVPTTGASVEAGIFESRDGGFSIAISQMPLQTRDSGSEKAKAKGIDTGKQFIWKFERTLYTAMYNPPVDFDGNHSPQVYEDMETGTRKGIFNGKGKLISEKPIKFRDSPGTEFRYVSAEGVGYISRIYLIGDFGYQIAGGYADKKYETEVLEVLNSFKPIALKNKP